MTANCIVLGAGGHAKVVIDALRGMAGVVVAGVLTGESTCGGAQVLGVPVLGNDGLLSRLAGEGITHFTVGIGGIGPNPLRERLFEKAMTVGLKPLSVVHPAAVVSAHAVLEDGVQVFAGAIVHPGARLCCGCIINTGVIVEHDAVAEEFAHLASGCRVAGEVVVGRYAFVGAGVTVIQRITIGASAFIGAGAVVIRDVPDDARVAGVPARIMG